MVQGGGGQGTYGVVGTFDIRQIQAGARAIQASLNQVSNSFRQLGTQTQNFINRPAQQLIFLGLDLQQLAGTLALISAPIALAGGAATKFSFDFQNALGDINALLQVSDEEVARLGEQLRSLATDPQIIQGPIELAQAYKFLASSGFEGAKGIETLRAAAIGAGAGNADLAVVTKALASILNALPRGSIRAQEAIDLLAFTVDKGIIEFEDLASGLGETIGAVGAVGLPFSEASAAIATITRAGIPAAETMTSLNRLLFSFIAPTAEAKELANELGVELSLAGIRSKGLVQSLNDIVKATRGDTEALSTLFGDIRAVRGALALTRNEGQDFIDINNQAALATQGLGTAAEQLAQRLKEPGVQLQLLIRDLQNSAIVIGADFVRAVVFGANALRSLAKGFIELPRPLQIAIEGLGGLAIALTGIVFIAANIITSIGAIGNFFRNISIATTGATTAASANTAALAANTAALNANAVALGGHAAASGVATAATGGFTASLLRLAGIAGAVGAAIFGVFKLGEFIRDNGLAKQSTDELIETIQRARSLQQGAPAQVSQGRNLEAAAIKEITALTLEQELAFNQAKDAQAEFIDSGVQNLPKVRAQFERAAQIVSDPEIRKQITEGLKRISEDGTAAITESGFSVLSSGQKFLVREAINNLQEAISEATSVGDTKTAQLLQSQLEQRLASIGGLDLRVPINIETVFQGEIALKQEQIAGLQREAERSTQGLQDALKGLEAQQRRNQIAQLLLNLSLSAAQRALKDAQEAVQDLKTALQDAQDRLSSFSQPVLVGMTALDDAIFAVSQRVAQLNLELLGVQASFIPATFDAEEEVLRLRLALLLAGEEAEALGKKAQFGIDDLISAQQRELREGVPVLRTIFEKIEAAARGETASDTAVSPERKALDEAEKRLEIIRIEQQLAEIGIRRQLELEGIEQRRLELTREITFEPLLRQLEQMAITEQEITFEEAVAGIQQAKADIEDTNARLEEANSTLEQRQSIVDVLQEQSEELNRQSTLLRIQELEINDAISARNDIYKDQISALQNQLDILTEQKNEAISAKPHFSFIDEKVRGLVERTRALQDAIASSDAAAISAHATETAVNAKAQAQASQSIIDQAASFITSSLGNLLSAIPSAIGSFLGGLGRGGFPALGGLSFHEGGEVASGLPVGTEVVARLQAGEHVLTGQQFSQIASLASPQPSSSSINNTTHWNFNITNNRNNDFYAKLEREYRIRRLGGRRR